MLTIRPIGWLGVLGLLAAGCAEAPTPALPAPPAPSTADPRAGAGPRQQLDEAKALCAQSRWAQAEPLARSALRAYQQLGGTRHPDALQAALILADIELHLQRHQAAEQTLLFVLAAREAEGSAGALRVAETLDRLGEAALREAPDRAATYWGRALGIRRAALRPDDPEIARTLAALGKAGLASCRAADAEAALREALSIRERAREARGAADLLVELSEARWQIGDDSGAEQLLARAAAALEPIEAAQAASLVDVLLRLAAKEGARKDLTAAAAHEERALAIAERRLGVASPVLTRAADALADTHHRQGNEAARQALFVRLSLVERVLPPGEPDVERAERRPTAPRCTPPGAAQASGVLNASAVVASLAPAFHRCYASALKRDPNLTAQFRITALIGPSGEVRRVRTLTPASYEEGLVTCPMRALLAAKFAPPAGGGATLVLPLTFTSN